MIIRERQDAFVMITQDDHARLSGRLCENWSDTYFNGPKRASVELAVDEHDRGWHPLDQAPFWNDERSAPFSFIDFPDIPKMIFYQKGIDEVEEMDPYAAILCSHHYTHFAAKGETNEEREFVSVELSRQKQLIRKMNGFDKESFAFHYDILNFLDHLSLILCMNEPGSLESFRRDGVPVPATFSFIKNKKVFVRWQDERVVELSESPFAESLELDLKQKVVSKKAIQKLGLQKAYAAADVEQSSVTLTT